jgi:hypothetical protein
MGEYEEKVVQGIWDWFDDGEHDYVKDIRLEGTTITVTFFDRQSGKIRDMDFDVYDEGLNTSGRDYPEAVGAMIAIHVDEEEGAVRRKP